MAIETKQLHALSKVYKEAVYGKSPEQIEVSRRKKDDLAGAPLTVTNADKKANTPAWKNYKAGKKGYKAADHLKDDKDWGYDKKGQSLNPVDIEKRKRKEDKLFGSPKVKKESFSNWREDLKEVPNYEQIPIDAKKRNEKITEKNVKNTIKINPEMKEELKIIEEYADELSEADIADILARLEKKRISKGGDPDESPLGKKTGRAMKAKQDEVRKKAGVKTEEVETIDEVVGVAAKVASVAAKGAAAGAKVAAKGAAKGAKFAGKTAAYLGKKAGNRIGKELVKATSDVDNNKDKEFDKVKVKRYKETPVKEAKEVDVKDTRRTVDAIRAYDRAKDASRDATYDTDKGKKKKGDKEKAYAAKERGEIDKDDPNWKKRKYHTGIHGESYEATKTKEVMTALKKRDLKKDVKKKIAADIVKRKGDTSKSDDRYAYESKLWDEVAEKLTELGELGGVKFKVVPLEEGKKKK